MAFDIRIFLKKLLQRVVLIPLSIVMLIIILILVADFVILPWYVSAPKVEMPDVVGKHKDEAVKIMDELNLTPIEEGPRFDERFPKDHVMFQNPRPGTQVKENRRVYLFISGGDPLIKMPNLLGKTIRDARVTLTRIGLIIGNIDSVRSEFQANTVIEQQFEEGVNLEKGDTVALKVSVGPKIGMIRVPNLMGKSLREAQEALRNLSLRIGRRKYIESPNLLPNTIVGQYPSENTLINIGDSIDVDITKSD